ncbi:hypothetical protein [Leptolyngbya sp. GB1-A1]|jgi:hypothetical protein|uniref:hypothetical protein n=1 Tax=unclassified Leptolyngbya TaxID=2650499 RepID=UPI0019BEBEF5|nr:hypothetical protein [Cyanobacteria bacterium FACHB-502]
MTVNESRNVTEQVAEEDWFSRGRADALMGYSKQPPETDPEQSSLYDLGYGEGSIQHSLAQRTLESEDSESITSGDSPN